KVHSEAPKCRDRTQWPSEGDEISHGSGVPRRRELIAPPRVGQQATSNSPVKREENDRPSHNETYDPRNQASDVREPEVEKHDGKNTLYRLGHGNEVQTV